MKSNAELHSEKRPQKATSKELTDQNSNCEIRSKIRLVNDVQVMLDRDLAELYGVETRVLNQAVRRNLERFPKDFMFQLTIEECSRSQIVTLNGKRGKNIKYLPYVFSESGIAMLSSVLRSKTAIEVNIRIMRAFVEMRKTLSSLAPMLARIEANERRQITDQARNDANQEQNEARFKLILDAMQDKTFPPQKVFYDGQVYDAKAFAIKHILSARKSIILIDSWVDVNTLEMLSKKRSGVTILIVSSPRGNHITASDITAFNTQYGGLTVRTSAIFHDRFLVLDDKTLYLFGASLKDLGKKCFAFTKLDAAEIPGLKARI